MSKAITKPVDFFGHQLGADCKMARWDKIVEYFYTLESESDRLKVVNMGPSTEGNPFLAVYISAPENLKNLDYYKEVNAKITDPRGIEKEEIRTLVKKGKAVIVQSMSLHASEIGGTQMAPELAYDMVVGQDEENLNILNNVIFIMVPCFNPDGQQMVTDWYNEWLGTEFEGCSMPWLYHKYCGHDNNRDAFALNLVESQYMANIVFQEWHPHAYQDHHHMGSYGARLYVAPYCDPIRPHADPLIWRELSWYGAHMTYKLEEKGKTGILNGAQFPAWGHFGYHWITNHHNIAGMLTESASANLASPKYIEPAQLTGSKDKSFPEYQAQTNFPHPWEGGWWRLRDIVEQQKIAAVAVMDMAARNKETVLWNAYQKAIRQTERGAKDCDYAYIIPAVQHDSLTTRKLIQLIINQGIEVKVAETAFKVGACTYPAGTYVVFLAQPKLGVIKNLLGRTLFPTTYFTTKVDGTSMAFDTATDTVAEYMGVDVVPAKEMIQGQFCVITQLDAAIPVVKAGSAFVFDGRLNDSYKATNLLLHKQVEVSRLDESCVINGIAWPAGTFYTEASQEIVEAVAKTTGVPFYALEEPYTGQKTLLKQQRIGLFQRYWGGNADEGWTRLVFENFGFDYKTIRDQDLLNGDLNNMIDVLILPSDETDLLIDVKKAKKGRAAMLLQWFGDTVPPKYQSGFGEKGLIALRTFVENGGRLVTLNKSCNFAIEAFKLKVSNIVKDKSHKEYLTHGSTLHAKIDNTQPLGYGMPKQAIVFNWDSPVLKVEDRFHAEQYQVVMRYAEKDILQSGQLNGEKLIANQAAEIYVKRGKGDIVLIAVAPQHRGQMHGTFKLLFNTLY